MTALESKDSLETRLLLALGLVARNWTLAEQAIEQIIWYYLKLPVGIGRSVTVHIQNASRLSVIRNLLEHFEKDEKAKNRIVGALAAFDVLRQNRNVLIHSTYAVEIDFIELARTNRRTGQDTIKIHVSPETIEAVAADIESLTNYLIRLYHSLGVRVYDSPMMQSAVGFRIEAPSPGEPPTPARIES